MRVGLTFDRDATGSSCLSAAREVAEALTSLGHQVVLVGSAADLIDKLAAGGRFEMVFNCNRSTALVPALLDLYGMACSGSSAATMQTCQQQSLMKSVLRDRGVPTTDYWLVETLSDIPRVDAAYPVVVSAAMTKAACPAVAVSEASALSKACCHIMGQCSGPAIVQPQLSGPCFEVGLLGSGASATVLMPDSCHRGDSDSALTSALERTAQAAWRVVGGWDVGSMQLQCDADGVPHVQSIDPLPCLAADSALAKLAAGAGLSFPEMLDRIVQSAVQRSGLASHGTTLHMHLAKKAESQLT